MNPPFNPVQCRIIAALLISVFVVTAAAAVRDASSTWDEPFHLGAGISHLQTNDPRLHWDHPPLARLIGSLPALFRPIENLAERSPEPWQLADLYKVPAAAIGQLEAEILWPGRLCMLSTSLLLGWVLYLWGARLFGPRVALLPVLLMSACPPFIANAPIIATDMAATAFMFAAVYGWWRYLDSPSTQRLAGSALAVAAAFATKITAALLVPIFAILAIPALVQAWRNSPRAARTLLINVIWAGAVIGGCVWCGLVTVYSFDGMFLRPPEYIARAAPLNEHIRLAASHLASFWPESLPVPLPFYFTVMVLRIAHHVSVGHLSYFLGEVGSGGWPNFFSLLLLIKLPLGLIILVIAGLITAVAQLPKRVTDLLFLVIPAVLMVTIASRGNLQIGIRHILPALPFLLLLVGYVAEAAVGWLHRSLLILLVSLALWSTHSVYPSYLMYFNFLAGGPEEGWRITIEGDDWGQGGAALARWLKRFQIKELYYGGFGWSGAPLWLAGISSKPVPCEDPAELTVVHLGHLLKRQELKEVRCYDWMRIREPDLKIGYSIFLYNTHRVPRPLPPLDTTLFAKALAAQLSGDPAGSVPLYERYLGIEPDYYQAHFNLGCALKDVGRCQDAIAPLQRTLELWPGYLETHQHLAECYRRMGRPAMAAEHDRLFQRLTALESSGHDHR